MSSPPPRRVFISFAHESTAHVEAVSQLWRLLRANGVDARLDLSAAAQRQDWPLWMLDQFRQADFVVVVASAAYRKRAEGHAATDEGRGVQFEGGVLRELHYADRATWTRRILPVILPGESPDGIPVFLGPLSNTSYPITTLSTDGISTLLRVITAQPAVVEPPLGQVPHLPPVDHAAVAHEGAAPEPAARPGSSRPLDELSALADAFGKLPEFATAPGRYQAILLLPPNIRGAVDEAPSARLHIIAIIRACARFGPAGRDALLDILRAALPEGDPAVERTAALIQTAAMFRSPG
jgi:hypothetical protein